MLLRPPFTSAYALRVHVPLPDAAAPPSDRRQKEGSGPSDKSGRWGHDLYETLQEPSTRQGGYAGGATARRSTGAQEGHGGSAVRHPAGPKSSGSLYSGGHDCDWEDHPNHPKNRRAAKWQAKAKAKAKG